MAYIGAEDVKAIRTALKAKYPNLKFGCRKGSGSLSVDVTIKQGDVDFSDFLKDRGYAQINHHWINDMYPNHAELFNDILNIIKTAPERKWFDESDAMTDYFHTAFYIHLNVGEWDQPYAFSK